MGRKAAEFGRVNLPPVTVPDPALWGRGYVSINHAAQFLDVSRGTVRRFMRLGMLPWKRIGGMRRISRAALEAVGETG